MKSRPWLAVAVYVRTPAADAPIASDIAPNSDSAVTYSQGARVPAATISASASTMWVCGEIGYAGMTCGRHRATASATARDPSICLSTAHRLLSTLDRLPGGRGGRDVALRDRF